MALYTVKIDGATFTSDDRSRPYCAVYRQGRRWLCAGWYAERRDAYSSVRNYGRTYHVIEEGGSMDTMALSREFSIRR